MYSFATWQMPMGNYIVCGFEAENFEQLVTDAVYKAWKYIIYGLKSMVLKWIIICALQRFIMGVRQKVHTWSCGYWLSKLKINNDIKEHEYE